MIQHANTRLLVWELLIPGRDVLHVKHVHEEERHLFVRARDIFLRQNSHGPVNGFQYEGKVAEMKRGRSAGHWRRSTIYTIHHARRTLTL